MRFTRLKKNIEAGLSISTAPSSQTAKQNMEAGEDRKTNAKRKKTERQTDLADKNIVARPKIKKESAGHDIPALSVPAKRNTREKEIDVSTALHSDASPTPGARLRQEDNPNDCQEGQQTAGEDDGPCDDGEIDRPAKRRGVSALERKISQPYFRHEISSYQPRTRVAESDGGQPPPTSAVILPCLNDIAPRAASTIIRTPTQAPTDLMSLQITQSIPGQPTHATSNHTKSPISHPAFDHALRFDIMPSIEYNTRNDDASEAENLMDSTTAPVGSSASAWRETMLVDKTRQNESAFD